MTQLTNGERAYVLVYILYIYSVMSFETAFAFTQRVVDDTGISVFIDKLSMVKWNVNDSDANITYSSFFSKFKMLFDKCFPLINNNNNNNK